MASSDSCNVMVVLIKICVWCQMAFRLLVRRVCGVSVRDLQRLPAGVWCSSSFSSRLNTSQPLLSLPRLLPLSSCRSVSFNVQDHDDFTERVINSQLPVLIDFHAQYVLTLHELFPPGQPAQLNPSSWVLSHQLKTHLFHLYLTL